MVQTACRNSSQYVSKARAWVPLAVSIRSGKWKLQLRRMKKFAQYHEVIPWPTQCHRRTSAFWILPRIYRPWLNFGFGDTCTGLGDRHVDYLSHSSHVQVTRILPPPTAGAHGRKNVARCCNRGVMKSSARFLNLTDRVSRQTAAFSPFTSHLSDVLLTAVSGLWFQSHNGLRHNEATERTVAHWLRRWRGCCKKKFCLGLASSTTKFNALVELQYFH